MCYYRYSDVLLDYRVKTMFRC